MDEKGLILKQFVYNRKNNYPNFINSLLEDRTAQEGANLNLLEYFFGAINFEESYIKLIEAQISSFPGATFILTTVDNSGDDQRLVTSYLKANKFGNFHKSFKEKDKLIKDISLTISDETLEYLKGDENSYFTLTALFSCKLVNRKTWNDFPTGTWEDVDGIYSWEEILQEGDSNNEGNLLL